jgi:hypothetical protein
MRFPRSDQMRNAVAVSSADPGNNANTPQNVRDTIAFAAKAAAKEI